MQITPKTQNNTAFTSLEINKVKVSPKTELNWLYSFIKSFENEKPSLLGETPAGDMFEFKNGEIIYVNQDTNKLQRFKLYSGNGESKVNCINDYETGKDCLTDEIIDLYKQIKKRFET